MTLQKFTETKQSTVDVVKIMANFGLSMSRYESLLAAMCSNFNIDVANRMTVIYDSFKDKRLCVRTFKF